MNLFRYKSALDIPELKNSKIDELIKKATSGNQLSVAPNLVYQINDLGVNVVNCAIIVTGLLRVFDEFGSHPIPVFRALSILLTLLKKGQHDFVPVARALVPEIETVLHLTFNDKRTLLRPQIHSMAHDIYNFLMYDSQLPEISKYMNDTSAKMHLTPPPVDNKSTFQPVVFMNESKNTEEDDDDDMDIPFEPMGIRHNFNNQIINEQPQPVKQEIFVEPQPEPEPVQEIPQQQEEVQQQQENPVEKEHPKTPEERMKEITQLKYITKAQYDCQIESF